MSKRPLNERLDELYEVLLSGTNSVSGYDRLVSASAVEEVRAINAELLAENTRLRKCVSEEWDAVAADKILADVEHLRTINAELLAACKSVVRHEAMAFQNCQVAIKKAKGD